MIRYILKRILSTIPVLLIIATITFFIIRIVPGGPFDSEKALPPEILETINKKYHFDEPLYMQYLRYIKDLAHLDLGPSFKYANRSVNEIIMQSFPVSFELGFWALLFASIFGIIAGILSSLRHNSRVDYFFMGLATLGISLPSFVLGPLLVLIFALHFNILPVAGWSSIPHMIMPVITLGAMYTAYIARLTRGGMLEIVNQDFIRTARAKGLKERTIVLRHTLKGGLLPVVTFLGPAFAGIVTGSLVVETIFNVPGLGRYFIQSALNRDYTMVMGTVLFYAVILIFMNLVVDIVYTLLDPRVKYE